ncbi:MAG: thermonuclease family protein [Pseudomonadota bacterium]
MIAAALTLALCPTPPVPRHHCVHDGDTLWLEGEKIRIADIDTPELNGRCERERKLAIKARDRLIELVNRRSFEFERIGRDTFGRTLARMPEISEQLVREGLAQRWKERGSWC